MMSNALLNIFLLGLAFMILFTAFQTTSIISQSVLEGVMNETRNGTSFHGSGYVSQAIVYSCCTIANLFAPAAVSIFGPTVAMFVGGTTFFFYIFAFISPMTWSFYATAVLLGIGGALLWTAQGVYLSANSDESTVSRNSGIFWALFQMSLLLGNIYVYISLKTAIIDRATRYSLFAVFSTVAASSLVLFFVLVWRSYSDRRRARLIKPDVEQKSALTNVRQTLIVAGQVLKTRHMRLMLILFIYLGLSPTFFIVVSGTSVGHYSKYGDARKRLIGLHGLLVGAGGIVGGGLFGFITKPKVASQRAFIVLLSFILQVVFYYSVFINFPSDASARETDARSHGDFSLRTSQTITFTGSFIVGLGDSGFNTQVMNVLASRYKQNAAAAFAILRFCQGLGGALAFVYAGSFLIQWQLLILVVFLFLGTLGFFVVLFDDNPSVPSTFVTVQDNDHLGYQSSLSH